MTFNAFFDGKAQKGKKRLIINSEKPEGLVKNKRYTTRFDYSPFSPDVQSASDYNSKFFKTYHIEILVKEGSTWT